MPDLEEMTPGQLLADTNVATFIESLGLGIARAQRALDENSLNTAIELATVRPEFSNRSLLDLGFSPTFYHYQHADIEVSLQMTLRVERSQPASVSASGTRQGRAARMASSSRARASSRRPRRRSTTPSRSRKLALSFCATSPSGGWLA